MTHFVYLFFTPVLVACCLATKPLINLLSGAKTLGMGALKEVHKMLSKTLG
jgi:hypothetical protein